MNINDIRQYEKLNSLILEESKTVLDMFQELTKEKMKEYPNVNQSYNVAKLIDNLHYNNPFDYEDVYIKEVSDEGVTIESIELGYDWYTVDKFIDIKYFKYLESCSLDELRWLINKEVELGFKSIDEEYHRLIQEEKRYKAEQDERDRIFIEEMKKRFPKSS